MCSVLPARSPSRARPCDGNTARIVARAQAGPRRGGHVVDGPRLYDGDAAGLMWKRAGRGRGAGGCPEGDCERPYNGDSPTDDVHTSSSSSIAFVVTAIEVIEPPFSACDFGDHPEIGASSGKTLTGVRRRISCGNGTGAGDRVRAGVERQRETVPLSAKVYGSASKLSIVCVPLP